MPTTTGPPCGGRFDILCAWSGTASFVILVVIFAYRMEFIGKHPSYEA